MKIVSKFILFIFLIISCREKPVRWNEPALSRPRSKLTIEELVSGEHQALMDMSYFAKPDWGKNALYPFFGTIFFEDTEITFPKEKEYYPGENIFPKIQIDFISDNGELIPRNKEKIITRRQSDSYWDVIVGTGKVWHEERDGEWNRASFPLTLTDRWVGQARNCVATFIYKKNAISHVCLQCSQETADIDDKQLGNINGVLPVAYQAREFADSSQIIEQHHELKMNRLSIYSLLEIDADKEVADYFDKMIYTNAPTSLGAILWGEKIYLHPPKTRHGLYPYPEEMRHGLYSVTKSMAGALALMYFAERYQEDIFQEFISDYVPALANHEGWKGVTFSHALNMATGTIGGEGPEHLFSTLIVAETAEEAINNIANLGGAPELPGQKFNYASTNLFVLSYALQKYVEKKEGEEINYWHLVRENVLVPIGADHFSLLHTIEENEAQAIPILAYGALPTIDEAAKIALLFANMGNYNGQQILHKERVAEVFGKTKWKGYRTGRDFRGERYRHSFWSKEINTGKCTVEATYMLGFGENYVVFLPSNLIIFRFLDEHDLNIDKLVKAAENIKSSCHGE